MTTIITGNKIREDFINYFKQKGHTFVKSSSLVPGGDQTLLFTNAGMVQFKDVFLGTDNRHYTRAVNSQKCMRVSGKHNDLDDVGRDDFHHTFFEMLGNWSFADYYKEEAISWAWELLTSLWGLDKSKLWVTCFKDEKGEIPTDEEAANNWKIQSGLNPKHIVYFGRKDNFWEMAETGPCGPSSEIHFDMGEEFCDKKDDKAHICGVNGDCRRFLELWNLVFIQYNRLGPDELVSLPTFHVDTGMGFERIVSVLQNVDSNYKTDLFLPLIDIVMKLSGQSVEERKKNFTPYRVIADHCRAASFLIADGVVPGNVGRNYVCRMIIRRASRFGSKIGLDIAFLGKVAEKVVEIYGDAYPELKKNRNTIIESLTREEKRFHNTVEGGLTILDTYMASMKNSGDRKLDGDHAFELYATHGLPLEITKDVLREKGFDVDQDGFFKAMEKHRVNSGAGKEFGPLGGEDSEFYSEISSQLEDSGSLETSGIIFDPYSSLSIETEILSIIKDNHTVTSISAGEEAEIVIGSTNFYIESGGQVSDSGSIFSKDGKGIFSVEKIRKPSPGMIVHTGTVQSGKMEVGQKVISSVDLKRRQDIQRNHTATHLLHAKLREVLGEHVRQAGSLVAPERLRFDFTHPEALTRDQLNGIENKVNESILDNYFINISHKKLDEALEEGATALFGEKYGEDVRTISIGGDIPFSYELCGGTHVSDTGEIGTFIITSEGSVAAGIRRIEAITGREAYRLIHKRVGILKESADILECPVENFKNTLNKMIDGRKVLSSRIHQFSKSAALAKYEQLKSNVEVVQGINLLTMQFKDIQIDILRDLADKFRNDFDKGIAVFANIDLNSNIQLIVTVSDTLTDKDFHAGRIAKSVSKELGGSGGGRPNLAQAGGKKIENLDQVLSEIKKYIN